MNHFIAKIKSSSSREYFVGEYNKHVLRRSKIGAATIFTNPKLALQTADKIALENETVHVLPVSIGDEVMFGDL